MSAKDGRPNGEVEPPFTRPQLAIQPSLHMLDWIFRELTPFFGSSCPVRVIFNYDSHNEVQITGTLATMDDLIANEGARGGAIVLVG